MRFIPILLCCAACDVGLSLPERPDPAGPGITGITPPAAYSGERVVVHGAHFGLDRLSIDIRFGRSGFVHPLSVAGDGTSLEVEVPDDASFGDLEVSGLRGTARFPFGFRGRGHLRALQLAATTSTATPILRGFVVADIVSFVGLVRSRLELLNNFEYWTPLDRADGGVSAFSVNRAGRTAVVQLQEDGTSRLHVGRITDDPIRFVAEASTTVLDGYFPGVAVANDGRCVVAFNNGSARIFEVSSQRTSAATPPAGRRLLDAVVLPGCRAIVLDDEGAISEVDTSTTPATLKRRATLPDGYPSTMARPVGDDVLIADLYGAIYRFSGSDGRLTPLGHIGFAYPVSLDVTDDGSRLAVVSDGSASGSSTLLIASVGNASISGLIASVGSRRVHVSGASRSFFVMTDTGEVDEHAAGAGTFVSRVSNRSRPQRPAIGVLKCATTAAVQAVAVPMWSGGLSVYSAATLQPLDCGLNRLLPNVTAADFDPFSTVLLASAGPLLHAIDTSTLEVTTTDLTAQLAPADAYSTVIRTLVRGAVQVFISTAGGVHVRSKAEGKVTKIACLERCSAAAFVDGSPRAAVVASGGHAWWLTALEADSGLMPEPIALGPDRTAAGVAFVGDAAVVFTLERDTGVTALLVLEEGRLVRELPFPQVLFDATPGSLLGSPDGTHLTWWSSAPQRSGLYSVAVDPATGWVSDRIERVELPVGVASGSISVDGERLYLSMPEADRLLMVR